MRPILEAAATELEVLVTAVGGDQASPQRVLLAQDVARLGCLIRGLMRRWAETADGEVATRLGTLISARRAALTALGLDEVRVELDLATYLARQEQECAARGAEGTEDSPGIANQATEPLPSSTGEEEK